jgi:D-psicose/D-tagatose/L-ribulose 3-epimerase
MIRLSYILLPRLALIRSADNLQRMLAHLRRYGYQGVELNLTEPLGMDVDELARLVEASGLVVCSFLTGEAYADGLCLSAPGADVRQRTVDRLIGFVSVAARFKAVLVVGLLQGLRRDEPDPAVANARIVECLKQVAGAAASRGVDLVIEPVNHLQVGFNNTVAEVRALIAAIGSPAVRPMVDTIHLNIEERSLTEPILACGPELRHVHLCESNGGAFGSGHVDFAAVGRALETIGYDGFASVKIYRGPALEEAAASAINHLRAAGITARG